MTKDKALKLALEALERGETELRWKAITAIKEALAQPEQEPVAQAWAEGYRAGIADERTSEANIGIAWMGMKVEPARNNPYRTTTPRPQPAPVEDSDELTIAYMSGLHDGKKQREWVGLTDEEIETIYAKCNVWNKFEYERMLEAKLKAKNGFPKKEKNT